MFNIDNPPATILRGSKCFDCGIAFSLNSKQWHLSQDPALLNFFRCVKNLEIPGSGSFIDPSESLCKLCYKKAQKNMQKNQVPKSLERKLQLQWMTEIQNTPAHNMLQQLQLQVQQQVHLQQQYVSFPLCHHPGFPQPHPPEPQPHIHDVSKPSPFANVSFSRNPYSPDLMQSMLPSDAVVSVGNIGYASNSAVQQHLSPADLSFIGGSNYHVNQTMLASSRCVKYSTGAQPMFGFRDVLPHARR